MQQRSIEPPQEADFTAAFGTLLPPVEIISSMWGSTAMYSMPGQVSTAESSSAERAIFVHGVGTPALGLLPLAKQIQALNPSMHIVLYDLWGHGLSSTPMATHELALFHYQLLNLFTHLGWTSAHLVGFSFGGSVSTSFTALHPTLVESLTLLAPVGLLPRSNSWWKKRLELGGWGIESISQRHILNFINGGPLVIEEGLEERVRNGVVDSAAIQAWLRANHKGHIASVVSVVRYGGISGLEESYAQVARIQAKALIVLGETDGFIIPHEFKRSLEGVGWTADVVVIPETGHSLIREKAVEVATYVTKFWESLAHA